MTTLDELLELGPELGRGAFGVVRRGTLRSDGTPVAVKQHGALAPADHDRILREARLLEGLSHPRLTRLVGCWPDAQGGLTLVYEFVPGRTLEDHLNPGPLPLAEACRIASELADGLQALHHAGLIHRDLKPANVMINPEQGARLLDYGLLRSEGAGQTLTQEGQVLGTPSYMAPEQLTGARISPAVDQYALGCLIFEMCTGTPPSHGELGKVIDGHLRGRVPRLRSQDTSLPMALQPILDRMLAKAPEDRFLDARTAATALVAASQQSSAGAVAATQVLGAPVLTKESTAPVPTTAPAPRQPESPGLVTARLLVPPGSFGPETSPKSKRLTGKNKWVLGAGAALVALGFSFGPSLDPRPSPSPSPASAAPAWFEVPRQPLRTQAPPKIAPEVYLGNSHRKPLAAVRVPRPEGHGRLLRLRGNPVPFGDARFLAVGNETGSIQTYATRPLRALRDYLVDHPSSPLDRGPDGGLPLLVPGPGDYLSVSGVTVIGKFVQAKLLGEKIPLPKPEEQSPRISLGALPPEFSPDLTFASARPSIGLAALTAVWEDDFYPVPRRYAGLATQSPEVAWYADGLGPPRPCPVATGPLGDPVTNRKQSLTAGDHHSNNFPAPMRPFKSLGGWVGGWTSVVRLSGDAGEDREEGRRTVAAPPPPLTIYYSSSPDLARPAWILRLPGDFHAPPTSVPGGIALMQHGTLWHYSEEVLSAPGPDGYVHADRGRRIKQFPGLYTHPKAQHASAALWYHPDLGLDILLWKKSTNEGGERIEWYRMPRYPEGPPALVATLFPPKALQLAFSHFDKAARDSTGLRRVQRLAGGRAVLIGLTYTSIQSYFLVLDLQGMKVASVLEVEGLETLHGGPVAVAEELRPGHYWLYATDSKGQMFEVEHTLPERLLR